MKLRIALFLAAAFLAAALALVILPACSDEAGDFGDDSDTGIIFEDCGAVCVLDCFLWENDGTCRCLPLIDHDTNPDTEPICPN